LTGCADGDAATVVDLVVDEPGALLQLSEHGGHLGAVAPQQGKSLLLAGADHLVVRLSRLGPDV